MKKTVLLYILLALLFGFFVGLSVPFSYSLCTKGCPTPLLQICEHGFWNWTLRVLQVIGPIAAVIVALFKEDWVAYWYTPSLHIETSMDGFHLRMLALLQQYSHSQFPGGLA